MATVSNTFQYGVHGSRPTSGLAYGALYACSTHNLIYQTTDGGGTWVTWGLALGTTDSPQHTAVNIGHATDTTLDRASAGVLQVEGNRIFAVGGTDVPVADGGTGASTAAGARTNLGAKPDALNVITPTQLSANTDNWNPTSLSTADIIRASTDASRNLTGIVAPATERWLILANVGTQNLVLKHDVTSTAANRFYCPNDADYTLQKDTSVWLEYDTTTSRWRVIDSAAATAVTDATISVSDVTTNNASTSAHGWLKKLDNDAAHFMDGTGAWSTPSTSGSGLIGVTQYNPTGDNTYTISTTSDADVDATNLIVTFTAPASGNVLVRLSAMANDSNSGSCNMHWTVRESTTTLGDNYMSSAAGHVIRYHAAFYISGISAGSHTYKFGCYQANGTSVKIYYGSSASKFGPVVMEVYAAP